jgi:hypothetical protein
LKQIHPTAIKSNENFLERTPRIPRWLHVESSLFLSVHIGFLDGFTWRLQKEPPISNSNNSKIAAMSPWLTQINDAQARPY